MCISKAQYFYIFLRECQRAGHKLPIYAISTRFSLSSPSLNHFSLEVQYLGQSVHTLEHRRTLIFRLLFRSASLSPRALTMEARSWECRSLLELYPQNDIVPNVGVNQIGAVTTASQPVSSSKAPISRGRLIPAPWFPKLLLLFLLSILLSLLLLFLLLFFRTPVQVETILFRVHDKVMKDPGAVTADNVLKVSQQLY